MAVLTENEVRRISKLDPSSSQRQIIISKGDIITPSAKSYISEQKIVVKYKDEANNFQTIPDKNNMEGKSLKNDLKNDMDSNKTNEKNDNINNLNENKKETKEESKNTVYKYTTLFGANLAEKPEFMTHLRMNVLVFKDHPCIALRGKIDSLESNIIEVQLIASKQNKMKLVEDLEEIINFIRNLLRCEVTGEAVGDFYLQGLNETELRAQSHHPSKYFGIKHFLPYYQMGEMNVYLNKLRTLTRETELVAFQAFKGPYGEVERDDIIQGFNRLSSLFWIMMFKEMTGVYDESTS